MPRISSRGVARGLPNPKMKSMRKTDRSCGMMSCGESIMRNKGTSSRTSWRNKEMSRKRGPGRRWSSGGSGITTACTLLTSTTVIPSDLPFDLDLKHLGESGQETRPHLPPTASLLQTGLPRPPVPGNTRPLFLPMSYNAGLFSPMIKSPCSLA